MCLTFVLSAEIEWNKKKLQEQEEDEFEDLTDEAEMLREQELEKVCEFKKTQITLFSECEPLL